MASTHGVYPSNLPHCTVPATLRQWWGQKENTHPLVRSCSPWHKAINLPDQTLPGDLLSKLAKNNFNMSIILNTTLQTNLMLLKKTKSMAKRKANKRYRIKQHGLPNFTQQTRCCFFYCNLTPFRAAQGLANIARNLQSPGCHPGIAATMGDGMYPANWWVTTYWHAIGYSIVSIL